MRELLERYKGLKEIILLKDDNFLITGEILEISENAIIFKSRGKELLISFDRIKEIRPPKLGYRGR